MTVDCWGGIHSTCSLLQRCLGLQAVSVSNPDEHQQRLWRAKISMRKSACRPAFMIFLQQLCGSLSLLRTGGCATLTLQHV